jgi:hypothetical protein
MQADAEQGADSSVAESERLFVPPSEVKGGPEKMPTDGTEQAVENSNSLEVVK